MPKTTISTADAPSAIGTYSQAIKHGDTVYISGQIPLIPATMEMVSDDIVEQITQVFTNLANICSAAGGDLNDVVKFNVYLTDLNNFTAVNAVMEGCLESPYPARAAIEVSALPKGALVEVDAVMAI